MKQSHSTCSIHLSDAVRWAKQYEGLPFHALFTDAPYHLTNDARGIIRYAKKEYIKTRKSGFMGQSWDGGDVAFRPETWDAFKQVLHDGAFGMSYAGSRGWHRVATAIEDAGFIIHPTIFLWAYGSGFPKATRIDTQIDAQQGIVIERGKEFNMKGKRGNDRAKEFEINGRTRANHIPQSDLAKVWQGHRYGLQALKPACEPIIVFQKPYKGRPVDNITKTGAGALNIEKTRILLDGSENMNAKQRQQHDNNWGGQAGFARSIMGKEIATYKPEGRWAANLMLDEAAAERLDEQSGDVGQRIKGNYKRKSPKFNGSTYNNGKIYEDDNRIISGAIDELGGASRFFYIVREQVESADPLFYTSKANGAERDAALGEFEFTTNMRVNAPRQSEADKNKAHTFNIHPTVKPLDLNRYLATLLLPPDAYSPRRLFVPFAGVASEMIGAMQAGWDEIEGVELMNEYVILARKRIIFYKNHSPEYKPRKKKETSKMQGQLL